RRRDPDDGRWGRHQRAGVRAHPRGAAPRQDRARRGQQRLRPRAHHDHRHPRDGDHRRALPVHLRHRPDQGLRGHARDRPGRQRVRLLLREQVPLRVGAGEGPRRDAEHLGAAMELLKNPNIDFLGKAKYFIALSALFIGGGLAVIWSQGLRYGVDFPGGTQLILHSQGTPEADKIRHAVDQVSAGAVIQSYGDPAQNRVLVRVGQEAPENDLDAPARAIRDALAKDYAANPVLESSSEIVGPIVGGELRQKAVYLTVLGLLAQVVYIAARFKGGAWGVAAAIAGLHDIAICLGFLTLFHYEITLNVIAALLTLVGYSVNDTVVVFDRVRENLAKRRKDPLPQILNDSMNQTLTRTLISNGTTLLAVLGLYLFGAEVLRGFSCTMVVGALVGAYSTASIASLVGTWRSSRG